MYKKYWKKNVEPLLLENGYTRISSIAFRKVLTTGVEIIIDIQKYKGKNFITVNITLNNNHGQGEEGMISALIDYRLGDFLSSRQYDIWWSVKKADIDESFLQIKNIMMKVLLPELKKLEDEEFAKKFIRNIELSYELG